MTVFWTDRAFDHLLGIREQLSLTSMAYAERAVDRPVSRSEQLGAFPNSGRRVSEYSRDDLWEVQVSPYRLIYRVGRSGWTY
ncbi:type II toxin-antitoxin system RelE/ParE family toxin [Rubrivirga sp. IMCC43871]|uniref:type II toxin-antitoxin system RelE/ParE family toxin n=1 Tax=Rubrivirga sp. IMCC43871 TaxID=3391575 RepID=UPI00398FF7EA